VAPFLTNGNSVSIGYYVIADSPQSHLVALLPRYFDYPPKRGISRLNCSDQSES
jgi:hypothetical protein